MPDQFKYTVTPTWEWGAGIPNEHPYASREAAEDALDCFANGALSVNIHIEKGA